MPLCPYCHTIVSEDGRSCPKCGHPLAPGQDAEGMNKKKLAGIIVACTIAIIAAVVLIGVRPWEGTPSAQTYVLTTVVSPSGAGSISPSSGEYGSGTHVALTASPDSGYTFDYWSGDASDTISTITVAMDSDVGLAAHFKPISTVPEVLFSDEFSDESSGWLTYDEYDGRVAYLNGCFHVKDYTVPDWSIYGESQHYFADFVLEVETWLVDGTDDNYHVVFCRWKDEDNCYGFGISADGYYAVNKFVDGDMTTFVGPTYSSYIRQGQGVTNLIHIECIGSDLSLTVNGQLLWKGTDATFDGGDIALAADAIGGTFTEVAFDNIMVAEPFETIPTIPGEPEPAIPAHFTTYTDELVLFSISYPQEWEPVQGVIEEAEQAIKDIISSITLDLPLEETSVIFVAGLSTVIGFNPNVNIVVEPPPGMTHDEVVTAEIERLKTTVSDYHEFSRVKTTIDNRTATIIEWQGNYPVSGTCRFVSMLFLASKTVWVVTCTTFPDEYSKSEEDFDAIVRSLRILK